MSDEAGAARPASAGWDIGAIVTLFFLVSGAAALVSQITFLRAFVELFGSTSAALGATSGAFLTCLALGAWGVRSRADRSPNPLRLYAKLEALAALGGFAASFALGAFGGVSRWLAEGSVAGRMVAPWQYALALGAMLVPIAPLGATLPVLARLRQQDHRRSMAAGALQLANTVGAAGGVLLGSIVLVPSLGLRGSLATAASINAVVAIASFLLSRQATSKEAPLPTSRPEASDSPVNAAPFLIGTLGFGLLLVGLEVLLFRGVSQVSKGSFDSVAAFLAAFLVCHSLGTAVGMVVASNGARARTGFLVAAGCCAAAVLWALALLHQMASAQPWPLFAASQEALSHSGRIWAEAVMTILIAGPAAFFAGMVFPCVSQLQPRANLGFGRWVAWQSVCWTLGAALAGWLVPAWWLPGLGLRGALLVMAGIPLVAIVAAWMGDRELWSGRTVRATVATAIVAGVSMVPGKGAILRSEPLQFFRTGMHPGAELLAYGEGVLANVAVVASADGSKVLKVNNHLSLGGTGFNKIDAVQALLPSIMIESPERALVLGIGAGTTLGALANLQVPHIDAVEIEPLVNRSLDFFEADNGGVLAAVESGQVTLHENDARTFVQGFEGDPYDLILGDLFFPWQSEAGFLYTLEHFESVRDLLSPEGVFCQWLPGHQLGWEEIEIIGRTFSQVFRGTTMWLARPDFPYPVLGLIGGRRDFEIEVETLTERFENHAHRSLYERFGISDVHRLLSFYVGDDFLFRGPSPQRIESNTADQPWVEFLAARRTESEGVVALNNRRRLYEVKEDIVGRISTAGMSAKRRADLQMELAAASKVTAEIFRAATLRLAADANRSLPEAARQNDPEALELEAFQRLGVALLAHPDDPVILDHLADILTDRLRRRDYGSVITGTTSLMNDEEVGKLPRLQNLRGMALFLAGCTPEFADQLKDPLEKAATDFQEAYQADSDLVEAGIHYGMSAFLLHRDEEARAVLEDLRSRIRAPHRESGFGLPTVPEAILGYLEGQVEAARRLLLQAPRDLVYRGAVLERIMEPLDSAGS